MQRHIVIYTRDRYRQTATPDELLASVRQSVEARGDLVVGTFTDDGAEGGRRRPGWNALLASLNGVDQVTITSAADLPGRTVRDLLDVLGTLRNHDVGLCLVSENIDTDNGSAFTLLKVVGAYRGAKLSQAIRAGQAKALAAGKTIGRPVIARAVRNRICACLQQGGGIRPVARQFNVSPGSVINIRRSMQVSVDRQAA